MGETTNSAVVCCHSSNLASHLPTLKHQVHPPSASLRSTEHPLPPAIHPNTPFCAAGKLLDAGFAQSHGLTCGEQGKRAEEDGYDG